MSKLSDKGFADHPFLSYLHGRFFQVWTLERPLRLATGFALALLLADGLLIALGHVPHETTLVSFQATGLEETTTREAARSVLFASTLLLSAAWSFALVAVMFMRRPWLRLSMLFAFALLSGQLLVSHGPLRIVQMATLITILGSNLLASYGEDLAVRWNRFRSFRRAALKPWVSVLTVGLVFSLYFGSLVAIGVSAFGSILFSSVSAIAFFALAPVLVLTGTDFAEMTRFAAAGVALGARRLGFSVTVLFTLALSLGSAGFGVWRIGSALPIDIGIFFGLATLFLGVIRRYDLGFEPIDPPMWMLIFLTIVLYFFALFLTLTYFHNELVGLIGVWTLPFALWGFPAVWMIDRMWGRLRGFLYLVTVGGFAIFLGMSVWALRQAGDVVDLPTMIVGANASVGAATALSIAGFVLARIPSSRLRDLIEALLVLNVGFVLLGLLSHAFLAASVAGEELSVTQAGLILFTLIWDLAMSGHFTNHQDDAMPRPARVLLFLAYIIAVATAVLLISPGRPHGALLEGTVFSAEIWPRYGMILLGFPLLLATTIQLFRQYLAPFASTLIGLRSLLRYQAVRVAYRIALVAVLVVTWFIVFILPMVGAHLTTTEPTPSHWQLVYSPKGDFSLDYPRTWTKARGPEGTLLAAISEEPQESVFPTRLLVWRESLKQPMLLSDYTDERISNLRQDTAFTNINRSTLPLPAGDSELITASVRRPGQDLGFLDYVLVRGLNAYNFVFWTSSDRAAGQAATISKVVRTLRFF